MDWWEIAPLWLVGLAVLALLLAAVEIGYRGRAWLSRGLGGGAGDDGQNQLLAAVLGLLALLLGFTFSLSLDRYEARREFVVQEANALGTAWLRALQLEEPGRTQVTGALKGYAELRRDWSRSGADSSDDPAMSAQRARLWTAVGAALRTDSSPLLARGLMDAVNESIDLAAARAYERQSHIPDRVLGTLVLYATLSALMLGYVLAGHGRRHRIATVLTLLLLSLALVLILDLDRPTSGAIQVSQQPFDDLVAQIGRDASP